MKLIKIVVAAVVFTLSSTSYAGAGDYGVMGAGDYGVMSTKK